MCGCARACVHIMILKKSTNPFLNSGGEMGVIVVAVGVVVIIINVDKTECLRRVVNLTQTVSCRYFLYKGERV